MAENNKNILGSVLGLDLGGTKISAAIFSKQGAIIHKTEHLLGNRTGSEVGSFLVELLLDMFESASTLGCRIDSVGICVPGISNQAEQTVWAPNIPGWKAYPLFEEVSLALKNPDIPVSIESDRNCYILGEMWKGNARDCKNAIFVAVGTGIGMGIVSNGQIINGASGIAGAIGWLAMDRPYSSNYDSCGHFEYFASGPGIARHAGKANTREVFEDYYKEDPLAVEVITRCIEYWGMAVANLVSIFNPEKIIFGGGVFGPAIQLLDKISAEAKKWAQPISMQEVSLEASALEGNTGLYGAGFLALRKEQMP